MKNWQVLTARGVVGAGLALTLSLVGCGGSGGQEVAQSTNASTATMENVTETAEQTEATDAWVLVKQASESSGSYKNADGQEGTSYSNSFVIETMLDEQGNALATTSTSTSDTGHETVTKTERTFDADGNTLTETSTFSNDTSSDKSTSTTTYAYEHDDQGRVTKRTYTLDDGRPGGEMSYVYDDKGNLAKTIEVSSSYSWSSDSGLSDVVETETVTEYDVSGLMKSAVSTSTADDESEPTVSKATYEYEFDDKGHAVKVIEKWDGDNGVTTNTRERVFDENDNISKETITMSHTDGDYTSTDTYTSTLEWKHVDTPSRAVLDGYRSRGTMK